MTKYASKLVDSINKYIELERRKKGITNTSFLVFGATIAQHPKFKAYRQLTYKTILVTPEENSKELFSLSNMCNYCTESEREKAYSQLNEDYFITLLDFVRDAAKFDKLLRGEIDNEII